MRPGRPPCHESPASHQEMPGKPAAGQRVGQPGCPEDGDQEPKDRALVTPTPNPVPHGSPIPRTTPTPMPAARATMKVLCRSRRSATRELAGSPGLGVPSSTAASPYPPVCPAPATPASVWPEPARHPRARAASRDGRSRSRPFLDAGGEEAHDLGDAGGARRAGGWSRRSSAGRPCGRTAPGCRRTPRRLGWPRARRRETDPAPPGQAALPSSPGDLTAREHRWLRDGQAWASDGKLAQLRPSCTLADLIPLTAAAGVTATVVIQTVAQPWETPDLLALAAGRDPYRAGADPGQPT